MNTITWIAIIGIIGAIAYKKREQLKPIIQNILNKQNNNLTITKEHQINEEEIENRRKQRIQELINKKQELKINIQKKTIQENNTIREIELQIGMLEKKEKKGLI